jgi:thiol-disulfide isomerase/thioredoxin
MFKTTLKLVMATLCLNFGLKAQAPPDKIQPLKIGDTIPEAVWNMPIQTVSLEEGIKTVRLKNYKEQAIILDFGNTHCAPCLASLAHLDTLKNKFPNQLKVLGVTPEKSPYILTFLKKRKANWTYVAENTKLREQLFPYVTFPHLIWIKDKKVIAITDKNKVTTQNIDLFMKGQLKLPAKVDLISVDDSLPLMMSGTSEINNTLIFQSSIAGFISGTNAQSAIKNVKGEFEIPLMQMKVVNHSLLKLFTIAISPQYFKAEDIYDNLVVWEVPDSVKYAITPAKGLKGQYLEDWYIKNAYSYNLVIPQNTTRIKLYQTMQVELDQFAALFLGIVIKVEKRQTNVLALCRTTDQDMLKTKPGTIPIPTTNDKSRILNYTGRDFGGLVRTLKMQYQHWSKPIVDQTGYAGNIDLFLKLDNDPEQLRLQLKKYGLDLVDKVIEMDMLLISKIK